MKTRVRRTPWLTPRHIALACGLALVGAGVLFALSKRDFHEIARAGLNAEIERIGGEQAVLQDSSSVTLRPDLRIVVADPVFDVEGKDGALSLSRIDASLRPAPLLIGQAEIASLHLHRPELMFESLDLAAFLKPWTDPSDAAATPVSIEISDGTVQVDDAFHLSDLNMSIAQDGLSEGLAVQGNFVVGSRPITLDLELDNARRAFSDVGSTGKLSVRFDTAQPQVDAVEAAADASAGFISDMRKVVNGLYAFGRRPLTIEGDFSVMPHAVRISDATFSHGGLSLTGAMEMRSRSERPVLQHIMALQHSADAAFSDLMRRVDDGTWVDVPVSTDWMRALDVDVTLAGQDIAPFGAAIDDITLSMAMRENGLSVDLATTSKSLGRFASRADITPSGQVSVEASLANASLMELSQPIAQRMQARLIGTPQLPEGALDANLRIAGHGKTLGALFDSLSGSVTASMQDGSLSGGDVTATLQTLANGRQFMTKEKGPLIPAAGRTRFDLIDGQVGIEAGTARISSLRIAGERLEIDMLGEVRLKSGAISVVGNAQLSAARETETVDIARHVDLPFGIGGTVFTPMVAAGVPAFEMAAHIPAHTVGP